ncbi:MAG: ACT domain-containing protein [Thermodesulfobacteriota bacterium]
MKKVILSVLGFDRPGIIAAITRILYRADCNIESVSQTILQSQFSGTFIVSVPRNLSIDHLSRNLDQGMSKMELRVLVVPVKDQKACFALIPAEPFVITTKGPDRKGLVAGITEIIAKHGINVTNLQAVFKGGEDPNQNIMIYEVDIPKSVDYHAFHIDLRKRASALDLEISVQHRNIFEAINRI